MNYDRIEVNHGDLEILFYRTIRTPDDGNEFEEFAYDYGLFQLKKVEDYKDTVPRAWLKQGGYFLPIHHSEALKMKFIAKTGEYAAKVAVGRKNAITGDMFDDKIEGPLTKKQDYIVPAVQKWISGICLGNDVYRPFVASKRGLTGETNDIFPKPHHKNHSVSFSTGSNINNPKSTKPPANLVADSPKANNSPSSGAMKSPRNAMFNFNQSSTPKNSPKSSSNSSSPSSSNNSPKTNPQLTQFLSNIDFQTPISPKDAAKNSFSPRHYNSTNNIKSNFSFSIDTAGPVAPEPPQTERNSARKKFAEISSSFENENTPQKRNGLIPNPKQSLDLESKESPVFYSSPISARFKLQRGITLANFQHTQLSPSKSFEDMIKKKSMEGSSESPSFQRAKRNNLKIDVQKQENEEILIPSPPKPTHNASFVPPMRKYQSDLNLNIGSSQNDQEKFVPSPPEKPNPNSSRPHQMNLNNIPNSRNDFDSIQIIIYNKKGMIVHVDCVSFPNSDSKDSDAFHDYDYDIEPESFVQSFDIYCLPDDTVEDIKLKIEKFSNSKFPAFKQKLFTESGRELNQIFNNFFDCTGQRRKIDVRLESYQGNKDEKIRLTIKTISGDNWQIEVEPSYTTEMVLTLLRNLVPNHEKNPLSPNGEMFKNEYDSCMLLYKQERLDVGKKLSDHGIRDGSVIFAVFSFLNSTIKSKSKEIEKESKEKATTSTSFMKNSSNEFSILADSPASIKQGVVPDKKTRSYWTDEKATRVSLHLVGQMLYESITNEDLKPSIFTKKFYQNLNIPWLKIYAPEAHKSEHDMLFLDDEVIRKQAELFEQNGA